METDEKSQGFNELATTNPKPKDDGSSNLNPLHYVFLLGWVHHINVRQNKPLVHDGSIAIHEDRLVASSKISDKQHVDGRN